MIKNTHKIPKKKQYIDEISQTSTANQFIKLMRGFKQVMLKHGNRYYHVYKKDLFTVCNREDSSVEYKYWKGYNDCIWIDKCNIII